jgi:hypothetical protein
MFPPHTKIVVSHDSDGHVFVCGLG